MAIPTRKDQSVWRCALPWLMASLLVLQCGCANTVALPVPSQSERDKFGELAIVPVRYIPQSNFLINWRHKSGASVKQAALTAGGGTATTTFVAAAASPIAAPVIILTGIIGSGAMAVVDAERTSKGTVSATTALDIESAISKAVTGLDVQKTFAEHLSSMLNKDTRRRFIIVDQAGPDKPEEHPDYAQLRDDGIDTVIEVAIKEIGLDGCIMNNWECRPPHTLHFFMNAHARLVRVAEGTTPFEWQLDYKSGPHELTKWLADGGRVLGEEIEQAYRDLAERIYDEAFLITPIALPIVSNIWEERCWIEPLSPSRTNTLQPTLYWTRFPSEIIQQKLVPEVLQKISNVTYDLRIWDEDVDQRNRPWHLQWRNRLIYERTSLAAPQHALEIALSPASRYYWSVRARFVVDGQIMVTRWMRQSGCYSSDMLLGYYVFNTPE